MPYDFGPFGSAGHSSHYETEGDGRHQNSIFSLVVMIVVVAVIGAIVLGLAFMALGVLFHLAGWILKVAILAAVAALVWRRITRRRAHDEV
jgi:biotin transporter BioY